jgi:hypothetical protein
MAAEVFRRPQSVLLRFVLSVNLLLIALSFTKWFSGDANHAGFADILFGSIRSGGFRVDFLYVLASGLFAFVMLLVFASEKSRTQHAKFDAWLCTFSSLGTVTYVIYILFSGVLYFG